jgi:DNA-binding CsgD family transcriptional regulator
VSAAVVRGAQLRDVRTPTRELVGRDAELDEIVRALQPDALPVALVLCGEAGIGKTELWLAGREAASQRGFRVLATRPSEAETGFSYAGLADLLGEAVDDVLPRLPPVQRRALEAALLLGAPDASVDERVVAAAFLGALKTLAADGPLCLAVDDLQWLDAASLGPLRFALARLDDQPVAGLLAVRGTPPEWLRRTGPKLVEIHGLTLGATHELLRTRLDATFARPLLVRVWETSGGNPFFALELAHALRHRGGELGVGEELPISASLEDLLAARLAGLGPAALEVVQVVAALADPTVELVETAVGERCDAGLEGALAATVIQLDDERIRFAHPLLGSAVTAKMTPPRRRALHARLSKIAPTGEERARHLALASSRASSSVASALDDASAHAHARGAPGAAAELAEHALRLTPVSRRDDARRRALAAADMHYRAGDAPRARRLLERERVVAVPGRDRATVVACLAGMEPSPRDAASLLRAALAESDDDDALRAAIHLRLAELMRFTGGIRQGLEHGRRAVEAASRVDDPVLRCLAAASYGLLHFNAGLGVPEPAMRYSLALERSFDEWPILGGPTYVHGHQLWWAGDVDAARTLFEECLQRGTARDQPHAVVAAHWYLGILEWRAGNWKAADRHAAATLELTAQLGPVMPQDAYPMAIIAAHRGRVDAARAVAQRGVELAEAEGMTVGQSGHSWVLGFVELSLGDAAAALPHLRRAVGNRDAFAREPGMRTELGDVVEALVATGELDEADAIVATWEERARRLDRAWALAILARGRGLLRAARGDFETAFWCFEQALAEHARSRDPFSHARTLLALGRTERRAKRRGTARVTLAEALERFERVGAPLWAEQARAELGRLGGRPASSGGLTASESRIAELVGQGRTNREVAAALFLEVHTVETALTRIYRTLGVRSRAELARQYGSKT